RQPPGRRTWPLPAAPWTPGREDAGEDQEAALFCVPAPPRHIHSLYRRDPARKGRTLQPGCSRHRLRAREHPFSRQNRRSILRYNRRLKRRAEWRPKEGHMSMSLNRITRRDALLALGAAAATGARAEGGLLRATRVDHVSL